MAGGDTDTNACIVGGIVGAAIGYNGIRKFGALYIGKIFQFDCVHMTKQQGVPRNVTVKNTTRPEFLSVKLHGAEMMQAIIQNRAQPGDELVLENDHDPDAD